MASDKDIAVVCVSAEVVTSALVGLRDGLSKPGIHKSYATICERIGRLKERYKVGPLYTIRVDHKDGQATDIGFSFYTAKAADPGQYLIRNIRTTMDPTEFQLDIYRRLKMKSRPLSRVIYKHGAPNRSAETQKV